MCVCVCVCVRVCQDKQLQISEISSRFKAKLPNFIFGTLGTNGLSIKQNVRVRR